ncbi:MAG TPA: hypothetical protein VGL91_09970 [Acidobacteriota bacterium]|jgi:hypothetical protein
MTAAPNSRRNSFPQKILEAIDVGWLAHHERPTPLLRGYDQLLWDRPLSGNASRAKFSSHTPARCARWTPAL